MEISRENMTLIERVLGPLVAPRPGERRPRPGIVEIAEPALGRLLDATRAEERATAGPGTFSAGELARLRSWADQVAQFGPNPDDQALARKIDALLGQPSPVSCSECFDVWLLTREQLRCPRCKGRPEA